MQQEVQVFSQVLATKGDEGRDPSSLEPLVAEGSGWWVSRDAAGNANLGDEGGEGKEPPSMEPRKRAALGIGCRDMQRG
jgi:hypothetical protein